VASANPRTTRRAAGSSRRSRTASGRRSGRTTRGTLEHELAIVHQEKQRFDGGDDEPAIAVPGFMEELLAELTHLARRSPEISQRSGVSVRVNRREHGGPRAAALRRAVRLGETVAAPRVSDLGAVIASTVGKIELESVGDDAPEERVVERLITKSLFATFGPARRPR
jgi:magnesium chelatase subunit I